MYNFEKIFGYDPQILWQSLDQFSMGKFSFKDFIHNYGNLFLLFGLPSYLMFGKNLRALFLTVKIALPIISVFLTFLNGYLLLNFLSLSIYLFLLFLYGTNLGGGSLRHSVPEFGLVLALVGLNGNQMFKIIISGLILAFSFGLTLEYPMFATFALIFFLSLNYLSSKAKTKKKNLLIFGESFLLGLLIFLHLSLFNGVLSNKVKYNLAISSDFYAYYPSRSFYPRVNNFNLLDKLTGFIYPISLPRFFYAFTLQPENFQQLNLYVIPGFIFILLIYIFLNKKLKYKSLILTFLIYSTFAYYRTLNSPRTDKMSYGLNLFFLSLALLSQNVKKLFPKVLIIVSIYWLIISAPRIQISNLARIENKESISKQVYNGIPISSDRATQYNQVVRLIKSNTQPWEPIYVYPYGPFYHLANRPNAVITTGAWQYEIAPFLEKATYQDLRKKQPKIIVINTDVKGIKAFLSQTIYNVYDVGGKPLIESANTSVENFIESNYSIIAKYPLAWVLKKDQPIEPQKLYLKVEPQKNWYRIESEKDFLFINDSLPDTDMVKFNLKAGLPLLKILSKYQLKLYLLDESSNEHLLSKQVASGKNQVLTGYPKTKLKDNSQYLGFKIKISNNKGFIWWGKPNSIQIEDPQLFVKNKNLNIKDKAF